MLLPDRPFHNFMHQDQEIGEFYAVQESRAMDFEAPKLWKGRSGRFGVTEVEANTVHIRSEHNRLTDTYKWPEESQFGFEVGVD